MPGHPGPGSYAPREDIPLVADIFKGNGSAPLEEEVEREPLTWDQFEFRITELVSSLTSSLLTVSARHERAKELMELGFKMNFFADEDEQCPNYECEGERRAAGFRKE